MLRTAEGESGAGHLVIADSDSTHDRGEFWFCGHVEAVGLVSGFLGSKLVNRTGEGLLLDIFLGIVGAMVGGWLFHVFGESGVTGLNVYSMIVAVVGSVVVLLAYHALRRVV